VTTNNARVLYLLASAKWPPILLPPLPHGRLQWHMTQPEGRILWRPSTTTCRFAMERVWDHLVSSRQTGTARWALWWRDYLFNNNNNIIVVVILIVIAVWIMIRYQSLYLIEARCASVCGVRAPRAVVRTDPLHCLAGCRKRRLNQALSVCTHLWTSPGSCRENQKHCNYLSLSSASLLLVTSGQRGRFAVLANRMQWYSVCIDDKMCCNFQVVSTQP